MDSATQLAPPAPPAPPAKPPTVPTGPGPSPARPRRRIGCWVAAGLVVLVVAAAAGVSAWAVLGRRPHPAATASGGASAFASAMSKAGVSASLPRSPVPLGSITAQGSHAFDATFSGEELAALMNAFTFETTLNGVTLSLSRVAISFGGGTTVSLSGQVNASGSSYSGTVSAPAAYEGGRIMLTGAASVNAEGMPIGGAQAQQATTLLLAYANSYLAAAPGLHVDTAVVTPQGVHVQGTAPDSLSY
jgi:hypothetical protein